MRAGEDPVCRQPVKQVGHSRSTAFGGVSPTVIVFVKDVAKAMHSPFSLFLVRDRNKPH